MRGRLRHHRQEAELNITAFLNLMVILIPFLLITAAFSRFSILELYLPPAGESTMKAIKELQLQPDGDPDPVPVDHGGLLTLLYP